MNFKCIKFPHRFLSSLCNRYLTFLALEYEARELSNVVSMKPCRLTFGTLILDDAWFIDPNHLFDSNGALVENKTWIMMPHCNGDPLPRLTNSETGGRTAMIKLFTVHIIVTL